MARAKMDSVARAKGMGSQQGSDTTGDLIATASHELRQPMASIKGFAEMLLGHWADFSERDKLGMLTEILHDAERVARLVEELLDASRLDAGQLRLHRSETSLADMVHMVVGRLCRSYPALDPDVELSQLPPVALDPLKIEQVLVNLLENACKYGLAQGVRISGERAAGRVSVTVSDRGPGIPAADLPHVGEKFWSRAGGETSGLGLGLWISRGIIEAHGGSLSVASAPGQGTEVRFTIPVHCPGVS